MAKNKLNSYDYELKRGNGSPFVTDTQWMPLPLQPKESPQKDKYKTKIMNTNGEKFINALCERLQDEGKPSTDTQICILLRSLDRYEINQIVSFGTTHKWGQERIEKS